MALNQILAILLFHMSIIYVYYLVLSLTKKNKAKRKYFIILVFSFIIYTMAYASELLCISYTCKLLAVKIQYLGISFMPTVFLFFITEIVGLKFRYKKNLIYVLFLFSFLFYVMFLTNSYHQLVYISPKLGEDAPILYISFKPGILYYIFSTYILLVFILNSIMLVMKRYSQTSGRHKTQIFLVTTGTIIYMFIYILYGLSILPRYIDPNPFAAFIAAIFYSIAIFKYGFLGLLNPAQRHIFNSISQGVIIYDLEYNLIDYNQSAAKLFSEFSENSINKNIFTLLQKHPDLVKQIFQDIPNLFFTLEGKNHFYSSLSDIVSSNGILIAKSIIISSIPDNTSISNQ